MKPSSRTLFGLIREQAARYPEHVAAVDAAGQATYRELAARAGRVAAALQARGIGRGTRVGLLINNRREFLEAAFGAAALGAVVVPFSTWSKENELAYLLADSEIEAL